MRPILPLMLSLLLLSCGSPDSPEPGATAGEPESTAVRPEVEGALVISDNGVEGLPSGSAFDLAAIQAALPEFQVVGTMASSEGGDYGLFRVLSDGQLLLTLGPDSTGGGIGSAVATSPEVMNRLGPRVGDAFVASFSESPECLPGMESASGTVTCSPPGTTRFYYRFRGEWNGPDGELPPGQVLAAWRIDAIIWSAY